MKTKKAELTLTLPNWAKYVATDRNGAVYIYSHKPTLEGELWHTSIWKPIKGCTFCRLLKLDCLPPDFDFTKSLRKLSDYR